MTTAADDVRKRMPSVMHNPRRRQPTAGVKAGEPAAPVSGDPKDVLVLDERYRVEE